MSNNLKKVINTFKNIKMIYNEDGGKRMKKLKIFLLVAVAIAAYFIGINYVNAEEKEVKLNSFALKSTELSQDGKLYFDIDYEGEVSSISLWGKNESCYGGVFYAATSAKNNYFDLSETSVVGEVQVTGITLSKYEGGIVYYSKDGCDSDSCETYDFGNMKFTIPEKEKKDESDNGAAIWDYVLRMEQDQKVSVGDKVKVNLSPQTNGGNGVTYSPKPLSKAMLSFTNESNGEVLNVYLNSTDNDTYFIVPSTASLGKYSLNYGYLTFTDGTSEKYKGTATKVFAYGAWFNVVEKEIDKTKYYLNSENYSATVKGELAKLNNDAVITVNANNSPLVYAEVFDAIKSTDRTLIIDYQNMRWTFSGKDIVNPKSLDVSVKLDEFLAEKVEKLKGKLATKSAVLEFANNGELPGKALIRLDGKDLEKYFESDVLYVYYYDEEKDEISKVAMEVQKHDGFFEFYINHNSKYILTSEEVKEAEIVADTIFTENAKITATTGSNNNNILLYGGIGVLAVLFIIIVVIIIARSKKKKEVKENGTI